jgi:hypothetical protein
MTKPLTQAARAAATPDPRTMRIRNAALGAAALAFAGALAIAIPTSASAQEVGRFNPGPPFGAIDFTGEGVYVPGSYTPAYRYFTYAPEPGWGDGRRYDRDWR